MLSLSERGKPCLAYGFWRYRADQIDQGAKMLGLARENGIDHLDTADVYGGASGFGGAERLLGAIRAQSPGLLEGAVIATKAGCQPGSRYNSTPEYLKAACDGSLSRLGVERIDLFYIHRPDLLTHPADVAGALDDLVATGKIAAVGVSNFTVAQVQALMRYLKSPILVHQIEFSAAHVEPLFDGTLDHAMEKNIAVAAWSPMAGGRLGAGGPAECAPVRDALARLAATRGTSPTAMAIAFLQMHPACVTPILGTTTPERLRDSLDGAKLTLSRAEWYAIVEACRGQRMP